MASEQLPLKGLYIDDALVDLFTETIQQLISDMGRKIDIYLPPTASGCPNCKLGPDGTSQGIYISSNPFMLDGQYNKPFPTGSICSVCKGTHTIKTIRKVQYTALISRAPRELRFGATGKEFDINNMFLTKTVKESFDDIKNAEKAVIDGNTVVPVRDIIRTGLRDLNFVRMFWQKIDK